MNPFDILIERRLTVRSRSNVQINPSRSVLIGDSLRFHEAILSETGALATWGPAYATGRIPQDTYTVRYDDDDGVDWSQSNNRPMTPETFDSLFQDALEELKTSEHLYITDRVLSADVRYALPIRTITGSALATLFVDTMVRPVPKDIHQSEFAGSPFTLLVLPHDPVDTERYQGKLREEKGKAVPQLIAMDFRRRAGIVYGTSYLGAVKKLLFTSMNHLLPEHDILPLHCSAVIDRSSRTHLFLGLSGTGKTTLSSGPGLHLIGDDEHLWSQDGVANMENGCYAKLLHLSREKEPGIHEAVFGLATGNDRGVIIENAMVYPNGKVDVDDARLTENSRAAYPLSRLHDIVSSARGGHPSTILFLTADARGVLPPVAKLPLAQAMLWFLLGYTSKVAGTETGITEPKSTFSRFFGGPFMSRPSADYLHLFQSLVSQHKPEMYLMNTGWTGGPYGVGKRMDITLTRKIVDAALSGKLKDVPYREDTLFHLLVPRECPGVEANMLDPRSTWSDPSHYDTQAKALAEEFSTQFEKFARDPMVEGLREKCPGK